MFIQSGHRIKIRAKLLLSSIVLPALWQSIKVNRILLIVAVKMPLKNIFHDKILPFLGGRLEVKYPQPLNSQIVQLHSLD